MYPYAQLQTISNGICELRTETGILLVVLVS